ncbi:MAG TPA: hypothetical protein VFK02_03355 [Kofleriaceae bacterium]|nr:hypothetical protein [Kofleriaceae bacterium]
MSRAVVVVVTVALTGVGCAQIAGIDSTSDKGRNADTVAIERMSIGSTVVYSDLDLTGLEASYLVESAASATGFVRVTADDGAAPASGVWHADLPDPAPVELTLPDGPLPVPHLLTFASRALITTVPVLEHPGRTPAPDGAMLTIPPVTLDRPLDPTDGFQVVTVGSWTVRLFASSELPAAGAMQLGPLTYPFSTAASFSGRPELDRLTADDAVFVLRYNGTALTGVAQGKSFDQTGNDTVEIAAMMPVAPDQAFDAVVNPNVLSSRYNNLRPSVSGLSMQWRIAAAPAAAAAVDAGPSLQSGTLMLADVGISGVKYGNPFSGRGWSSMFVLTTSESRTFTPAGKTAQATLFAQVSQFLDLSAPPASPAGFEIKLDAGLPTTIVLDDHQLLTDGDMLPRPTRLVSLTFLTDQPATLFELQVLDLVPDAAGTVLVPQVVLAAAASEAKFKIPPETFVPGHTYTLRLFCSSGGFPALASGDLKMRSLPLSRSLFDSAVFTVTP